MNWIKLHRLVRCGVLSVCARPVYMLLVVVAFWHLAAAQSSFSDSVHTWHTITLQATDGYCN